MPESVNGWRWERHRVKVSPGLTKPSTLEKPGYSYPESEAPDFTRPHSVATWADCPGCTVCEPNDGLVLRRGSWRPTKAHEYIFLLAKTADYFCDAEAVREAHAEPWRGKGEHERVNYNTGGIIGRGRVGEYTDGIRLYNPAGRNLRDVWQIATQPLNSAFSYGKCRIASPDCPVHDYHADLERVLEYDAQQGVSQPVRNPGNGNHRVVWREGDFVSIPLDHRASPFRDSFAIPRSRRMNKTVDELERDVIFYGISAYHTEYIGLVRHCASRFFHSLESNTLVDDVEGALEPNLSVQTLFRIVGIVTFQEPPDSCTCYYMGRLKNSQDHFASFP